jgi:hypothetical protein
MEPIFEHPPSKTAHQLRAAVAFVSLTCSSCGSQAGEDYLGEPLLSMHGQAILSGGVAASEPIVPALCIYEGRKTGAPVRYLPVDQLPVELRAHFADREFWIDEQVQIHIVEAVSKGRFPAEFDIEVFSPPPTAAFEPLWTGTTNHAYGYACAVAQNHPASTTMIQVYTSHDLVRPTPDAPCTIRRLWYVSPESFYTEEYSCVTREEWDALLPTLKDPEQVVSLSIERYGVLSSAGDPALKQQVVAPGIVGMAKAPYVMYLEKVVSPNSYEAWSLGAHQRGLSAGYHLYPEPPGRRLRCPPKPQEIVAALPRVYQQDEALVDSLLREAPWPEQHEAVLQQAYRDAQRKACPSWEAPESPSGPITIEIGPAAGEVAAATVSSE